MAPSEHHVVFTLDGQRYALGIAAVERIVRAVEVTAVPGGSEAVLGVINVHGRILPVFNVRRRLGLPEHAIELSDQFIIVHAGNYPAVLVVDAVVEVTEYAAPQTGMGAEVIPGIAPGVPKVDEEVRFIQDLGRFLALDREPMLAARLQPTTGVGG